MKYLDEFRDARAAQTLVEAIAAAAGFNPEGGSSNMQFETAASHPGATIYVLDEEGPKVVSYEETEQVQLTRSFLDAPERFLPHLLDG